MTFRPATLAWFEENFEAATDVQRRGWAVIGGGASALLVAPTGSGKTLAAFLWAIDRLVGRDAEDPAPPAPGVRVLYVSPLKALVYDVERNLRAPLAGILGTAERSGEAARSVRVDIRTGDTPQRDRRRQVVDPAEILVTTPESLFLMLGSRARETLRTVEVVIVDEIHALAPSKRGAHLALSLERLAELAERDPQRIGLSATVRPLDEVARFLGGDRHVEVVDASQKPSLDLEVVVPVPDMENIPAPLNADPESVGDVYRFQPGATGERGMWPAIYPELLAAIRAHRSTILFVNNRGLCERLAQRLNDLAGEEIALAHHGSVSHEKRARIEEALKQGELSALVATSSLELGIDMGAVDLVILVESPGAVSRGLQRVGRAGHHVGETSTGRIFPKFKGDLLECAVLAERMLEGAIESLAIPKNALDVLAQQVVAMCCDEPRTVEWIERTARRSYPYRELSSGAVTAVLDMLSGRFPSSDFADLRPRLAWDRAANVLRARRGTELVSRMNAGTIPDRGAFSVHLGAEDGPRVGELDEEMVYETRDGDVVLLGATSWRVAEITKDRVVVTPAPGEGGRLPFWKGEGPGRPLELGRALGAFTREIGALATERAVAEVRERVPLSEHAARNLVGYVHDQREATGTLPTDRAITIERFRDELGDWRVCILSPFGSRVHAPWAMAIECRLAERNDVEVQLMYTDDGIVIRFADTDELPELEALLPDPDDVDDLVSRQLSGTSLFATLFRENAVRSLLVTRRRPEQRSPLWLQRRKSKALLETVRHFPSFPIVLETYRQAMSDVFDLTALKEVLGAIRSREVGVDVVETGSPSPFARSLVFAYVAAYLYDGDTPVAERKAQALTLDRELLAELLGQAELRELLDADVIEEVELELTGLADGRRARDADELTDLLRRVGDLTDDELRARAEEDPGPWLTTLEKERRASRITIAGEPRWIASEDAGLYRDALSCRPPDELPSDFLAGVPQALEALVRRYGRSRGPFVAGDLARRYGLAPGVLDAVVGALEERGALVRGEIRPGGSELDLCDSENLRRIKRRTLARLRDEVAPVETSAFARFLPEWQGVDGDVRRQGRFEEVVDQLQGVALPWSTWNEEVLPRRVPGFAPEMLDLASASGRVLWVGRGARGAGDGLVALYLREDAAALLPADSEEEPFEPPTPVHAALLDHLETRGASFLTELERAARGRDVERRELEEALWDLVWSGRVTNDTFQPLRTLRGKRRTASRGRSHRIERVLSGGRWSLVRDLVDRDVNETERALARATALLERYGVVSREAARDLPGGFGAVYRVLRAMEDSGRVQRGYFAEGLSGVQFALPGAVERLRAARAGAGRVRVLSANDPASVWGALVPWPKTTADERPKRIAGAHVVQVDGRVVLYVTPSRRRVVTFPSTREADLVLALEALRELPRRGRRSLLIETVDGVEVGSSPHRGSLERAGFVSDYRGYVPDPSPRSGSSRAGDGREVL